MRWWLKAAIQKSISVLPAGRRLHHFLQRKLWRSLRINETFLIDRLSHVDKHLNAWQHYHPQSLPQISLELGTGWYPIVPIGLYLSGVETIFTVDQNHYLQKQGLAELMIWLHKWHREGLLKQYLPSLQADRWNRLAALWEQHQHDLAAMLHALKINYWVGDARDLPYSEQHFELIHSNNTFEHIPTTILQDLMREMDRTLKSGGVMSHYIDMADHYSYGDARLSPFHYLRFSERQWSWIENKFQSQNRLRINQYEELYQAINRQSQRLEVERGSEKQLAAVSLASVFDRIPSENLRVLYAQLINTK